MLSATQRAIRLSKCTCIIWLHREEQWIVWNINHCLSATRMAMKCTCPGRSYGAHMGQRMPAYVCSWPIVSYHSGFNAGNVTSGGSGPKAPHLSQNSSKTMCVGPWHLEKWDFLMFLEKFLKITFQFLF